MENAEYKVKRIDGDYAILIRTDDGTADEILVARALLPDAIDEGTELIYEYLSYSIKE
ncbi:MAG: chorismate--pyruvate lyase [Clostridia bacterium]|nr:chorismate--pyruvate lyase [Clostridia bacterium]